MVLYVKEKLGLWGARPDLSDRGGNTWLEIAQRPTEAYEFLWLL